MPAQGGAFVLFPRLHIVTDSLTVVRAVVGHGPVAIQVRVKTSDRAAYELTVAALALCRSAGALCLVDDRVGVALAAGADGVHVGAEDLPVAAVRRGGGGAAGGGGPRPAPGGGGGGPGRRRWWAPPAGRGRGGGPRLRTGPAIWAGGRPSPRPARTGCRRRSARPGSGRWSTRCPARR